MATSTARGTNDGGPQRTFFLNSAPATDCPSDHTRFAIPEIPDPGQACVELKGCHNLVRPDGTLGRLSPEVMALLTE
jgi:hypothetical protein